MRAAVSRPLAMRLGAALCVALAATAWFALARAYAGIAPTKTAWYDNSGAQDVTGETTPSAAQSGELEVSYVNASTSVPSEPVPSAPTVPGAPVQPPQGNEGGQAVGNTEAFAAVEYTVPMQGAGGTSIDPDSLQATLTLTLDTSSSADVSSGDVVACPTATDLWSAGGDQDSGQAPQYSCSGSGAVTGNYDSTDNTVSFALSSAQESALTPGVFSVVIVPGSSPSGPFQAIFEPPAASSFQVTVENSATNPGNTVIDTGPVPSGAGSTPGSSAVPFGLQAYGPPSTSALPSGTTPSTPTSTPGAGATAGAPAGVALGSSPVPRPGAGEGLARTIAIIVLVALSAALVAGATTPARRPRSLRGAVES